jgi:hypothetical protein
VKETVIDITLSSLATWRIVHMLVYERGPYRIFWKVQQKVEGTEFGRLLSCVACASIWVTFFSCIPGLQLFRWIFSISAIVMFLEEGYGLLRKESEEEVETREAG